jgi:hypothetical protein
MSAAADRLLTDVSYSATMKRDQGGYPRPQLRREQWLSLNGPWRFTYDDELRYRIPVDYAPCVIS